MSLQDEIEETKKKLAEALESENQPEEEIVEEAAEEEAPAEEEKPAEETKPEEKPDDAAFARLRREAAAAKKRAEELAAENERLKQPQEEIEEASEVPPLLTSMLNDYQKGLAEREFKSFESQITDPDYASVSAEYANAMSAAIRIQNPRKSAVEIAELTKQAIVGRAAEYARAGYANPVEELFLEAKELGFTGKSFKKEESKPEPKPDMAKVAANRQRSTGMTAANGESKQGLSRNYIADNGITGAEWAKLSPAEKKSLMYGS